MTTPEVHPLWTFLAAFSGVTDEVERARLMATALPSLVPCDLAGIALLGDAAPPSRLVLQRDGRMLEEPR